jgi:hypothetical protein
MDIVRVQNFTLIGIPSRLPPARNTNGRDEHGAQRIINKAVAPILKLPMDVAAPAPSAIPLIKGTAVSRPVESILDEAAVAISGVRD